MSPRRTPWPAPRPEHVRGVASWQSARPAAPLVNAQVRRRAGDVVRADRLLEVGGVPVATSDGVRQGPRRPATVRAVLTEAHDLLILDGGDGSISAGVVERPTTAPCDTAVQRGHGRGHVTQRRDRYPTGLCAGLQCPSCRAP